ncbi:hypothetical protein [Paracoccus sp. (in: a-proteobacteria)]|uniref:hypothetical protein n=1 Tax=Paracoccus sp. TaxID=267 RepID=UPI0026E0BF4A|nr:hypothetical protein [Paracoccus sp. (in: a-proteobacteria)]
MGEAPDHRGTEGAVAGAFKQRLCAVGVGPRLIADDLEAGDTLLERRVVQIGNARLDGVVEALEALFRFGGLSLQRGDMLTAAFGLRRSRCFTTCAEVPKRAAISSAPHPRFSESSRKRSNSSAGCRFSRLTFSSRLISAASFAVSMTQRIGASIRHHVSLPRSRLSRRTASAGTFQATVHAGRTFSDGKRRRMPDHPALVLYP